MPARSTLYCQRMRDQLLEILGGRCRDCGQTWGLEFAHTDSTECTGRGRGMWQRLKDVRENISKYTLLCQPCHKAFDGIFYMNPNLQRRKK